MAPTTAWCREGERLSETVRGIAQLSKAGYLTGMKGITIKLSDETLLRLQEEARLTGRSVAALIREHVEIRPGQNAASSMSLYKIRMEGWKALTKRLGPAGGMRF